MAHDPLGNPVQLETERLLLRPWKVEEAEIQRELWLERDPRVPPHRRIDRLGRPTLKDFRDAIRTHRTTALQLLAMETKRTGTVVGYCGFTDSGRDPREPELAYELLARYRGVGYATESARAVLDWGRQRGLERVWASVWDWNAASLRVLEKLGFTEYERESGPRGVNLITTLEL